MQVKEWCVIAVVGFLVGVFFGSQKFTKPFNAPRKRREMPIVLGLPYTMLGFFSDAMVKLGSMSRNNAEIQPKARS